MCYSKTMKMDNRNKIIFIIALISLWACSFESKKQVAFLNPDGSKERWQKDQAYFIERAQEKGIEVILTDAAANEQTQYSQAMELINKGIKVLVIGSVNANTAASIVREAHKKNVQVIAYDRLIRNSDLDYYVSHNNVEVGEIMANYVLEKKPSGNYLLLYGDRADQNSSFVKEGIYKALEPHIIGNKINIIYSSFIEGWKGTNAEFEVNQFLDLSPEKPDVIIASGDDIAQGALRAVYAHQIEQVYVTGQNADLPAIKSILNGRQTMTVYKPLKELAYAAADLSFQILNGEKPEQINNQIFNQKINVPSILIPVVAVDKNNLEEVIIKSGFFAREMVYN
jgi:D-xylose transport system substrate-binding protein